MAAPQNVSAGTVFTPPDAPLRLAYPSCEKGVGDLIAKADSPNLIAGVEIEVAALWPDDRGYFLEIARLGKAMAGKFDPAGIQISSALSYPQTVKAFHYHLQQTDYWAPCGGMFQVALADLRVDSDTFGRRNTMYVGSLRPWRILIPPGVAHGYKVISETAAMMVYMTDRHYDPSDEGRIPYDQPGIAYDWETQHK